MCNEGYALKDSNCELLAAKVESSKISPVVITVAVILGLLVIGLLTYYFKKKGCPCKNDEYETNNRSSAGDVMQ